MKRPIFLPAPPVRLEPAKRAHRAVNFVIFVTIVSLGVWIIYGGTAIELLLATVAIALLGAAWVFADGLQHKRRLRRMREKADAAKDQTSDVRGQNGDARKFKRGPFDFGES